MSDGKRHKLLLGSDEGSTYAALLSKRAIIKAVDYGSFRMVVIDEDALGGHNALTALPSQLRDDLNVIALNGYMLDTTNPEAIYRQLPSDLRQTDMADAVARGVPPRGGLYLVQFVGPIQDAWLEALRNTDAEIVSYIASNAYVVHADESAALRLRVLLDQESFVQFLGDYEPAYRLSPTLQMMRDLPGDTLVDITAQVIDGPESEKTISNLKAMASEFVQSSRVLNYHNVELKIMTARLGEIARLDKVFALEERGQRTRLDEAQGQIVAGNLSGNVPVGPGYLSWLAGKGFTAAQFGSFVVEVVDDATSITGHPDLPASRVVFQNNPTNQTGPQGGHGFLNANIIGGFNGSTGSAFEDANGFNYGLGIAPFGRMGSTAIFGATASGPTTWENTAYGQGARISSNSWGFTTQSGGPVPLYDTNAQQYDAIVRDAQNATAGLQQLTIVFAAGNHGSGANTVSTPATAKNVLTVGASENVRQTGTDGCGITNAGADSANDIINFSSRGPVNAAGGDGRVKPDIVAPGTHIQAGVPQSNYDGSSVCPGQQYFPPGQTLYSWSSGTSQATPSVAGGAALVYQRFLNDGLGTPSPAMVKAILMNSAAYMNGTGAGGNLPSNSQGMGRMDLGRAFDGSQRNLVDQTQTLGATGQTYQVSGSVASSSQPFRVTLAWTDAPGPTSGAPYVNNLDLEVTVNGTTYKGNVFSGANSVSGGTADSKNNVESVFLPAGTSGNFTVTVRATNIAGDGVPGNADTTDQDFALVIYNTNSAANFTITVSASPSAGGSVSGGGTFPAGSSRTVIATANSGYTFVNWTENGTVVSSSASYTFTLNANRNLVANFTAPNLADLTVTALTAPTTGSIGGQITVATTVVNQGPAGAGPFRLGFYLSTDNIITTADTFTGWGCTYPSGLAAGASTTCDGQVGIPASLPPGTYFFGAIADDLGAVAESNESNNARAADTGPITLSAGGQGTCASPYSVVSGQPFNGNTSGGQSTFASYNCVVWSESGPERVHAITVTSPGTLTASLSNLGSNDLDVFILTSCSSGGCLAFGDNEASANVGPGTYYILVDGFEGAVGSYTLTVRETQFDFDADRKADISIFRPTDSTWWILKSTDGTQRVKQWGVAGDKLVPGDYDGDGTADIAVFRPSNGTWWILRSSDGGTTLQQFAAPGDVPVPGDYDGDGKTDIAIFRSSNSTWWILRSSDGIQTVRQWGFAGDKLVPADYDGDGKTDIAVFRPSNGTWWILRSSDGGTTLKQFAVTGDIPAPADYDGDNKCDFAVWRPTDGTWWILRTSDGVQTVKQWGFSSDKLVPADYDGDGKIDIAVFRPSNGTWWIFRSSDGGTTLKQFAVPGDVPVPAAYVQQ